MSAQQPTDLELSVSVVGAIQERPHWFMILGILLILLGITAIALPMVATLAMELLIGSIILVSGIVMSAHAWMGRGRHGFGTQVLLGALYLAVGLLMLAYPLTGALTLTLLLAVLFLVSGGLRLLLTYQLRGERGWGWLGFGAILSLLLGILILVGLPEIGAWVLGLFLGIDLLFTGIWLFVLALAVRRFGQP